MKEEENPDTTLISDIQNMVYNRLSNIGFKKSLVEELQILYDIPLPQKWLEKLHLDNFILGFEDKVYDFHLNTFREGTPEDMVTMSTGNFLKDVKNVDPAIYIEIKML